MAVTLLDMEKSVLSLLNESFNSPIGNMETGTGGAATIPGITPGASSVASTVKMLLNEGFAEIARTCYPIPEIATTTLSARTALLASLTPTVAGRVLWTVRGAKFGASALTYAHRAAIERKDPAYLATATGTPAYWYDDGPQTIAVYPAPSAGAVLTVDGYAVHTPLVTDTDTMAAAFPDDLTRLGVWYAAWKLATKNMEDSSAFARGAEWRAFYDQGRMDLWTKIDPSLRKSHFPVSPAGGK